jgi:hypothetical protein
MRYPISLVPAEQREEPDNLTALLEVVQPASVIQRLFGEYQHLSYVRTNVDGPGDVMVTLQHRNGLIGTLHLCGNQAATSPLERLEVVGVGANVVVENGVRLTYYRPGGRRGEPTLGRVADFVGPDEGAPIVWEPDFSLGQLYNKQLFLEGYVGCLKYFAEENLANRPPRFGNLVDVSHIMMLADTLREGEERNWQEG